MMKRLSAVISFLSVFCLCLTAPISIAAAEETTALIACSDFQYPNPQGNEGGKGIIQKILSQMETNNIIKADGFLCCGDYDVDMTGRVEDTKAGVDALKDAVSNMAPHNVIMAQGNHDTEIGSAGMSASGSNDPTSGEYGVFVINEDDYMWTNSNEQTIKQTAQNLLEYMNEKLSAQYDRPIFVVSHLPLHYSMRTKTGGDAMYAKYIFDVLNEAGSKGLNIVFLFGHDHSNGWDDYLGGSAVFLQKGDNILIAQNSRTDFKSETLKFTYMNAGYTGYYENHNGADDALTMTAFQIKGDTLTISRYDQNGVHALKSAGVTNSYQNETGYSPNTTVYTSPLTISLTKVTDTSLIEDVIPKPEVGVGRQYTRITNTDRLKDGSKYLLICSSSDSFMIPEVVTKGAEGNQRTGFDVLSASGLTGDVIYGEYADREWVFSKSNDGWLIGDGQKFVKFPAADGNSSPAVLETDGSIFFISSSNTGFLFESGRYFFNYNSRGLINGYIGQGNAAGFQIYEFTGCTISVTNGSASQNDTLISTALEGAKITLTANPAPVGKKFDKWVVISGGITLEDENSAVTSFKMPGNEIQIIATYKDEEPQTTTTPSTDKPHPNPGTGEDTHYILCIAFFVLSSGILYGLNRLPKSHQK